MTNIKSILVANRGEIAIRIMRAATELGIKTVGIYTHEDRMAQHRFKSDEAYEIGDPAEPLKPYLNIEIIVALAKKLKVDAIHPGYGFLSENLEFVKKCQEEGIIFIGPQPKVMLNLGNKILSKQVAKKAAVPVIEDCQIEISRINKAETEAEKMGYPLIIKAASGGGGRGMRIVRDRQELKQLLMEASEEAKKSFGDETIYIEKYVEDPKHIEVQILADNYGNIVHLFERDCSVQRRFQKVVEVAPAWAIKDETRKKLHEYAIKICQTVQYNNAGTVEFLLDKDENIYFIEVNPRIQVEHTITEEITGIDLIRSQILIAKGHKLTDTEVGIESQDYISCNGYAVQCRITTEDPEEDFKPDYGKIIEYRNASGFGIRLDEGNVYSGITISPFYDSMLVKVTARARSIERACDKMHRALVEFRIRGVKTNLGFLQGLVKNKEFQSGKATVGFIDRNQQLLQPIRSLDRATKTLNYISDVIVNGNPQVSFIDTERVLKVPQVPNFDIHQPYKKGTKDLLKEKGKEAFSQWLKNEKSLQITDTTFRDAHQSLLATRFRTYDIEKISEFYAHELSGLFSLEMWGGATFDVCMRFLQESPWHRLKTLRKKIPNILFQMLIRGSNAVGYTSYPDNLIKEFIYKSSEEGIDIFRIFDSLNWIENMKVAVKTVARETDSIAEASICYTGEILDTNNKKYSLPYYLDLAKELEDLGANMLAIKDMAGLLTPYAAQTLIENLNKSISIPIHLHTHDTSSIQSATYLKAVESGVDVVDLSLASMSGLTSQPNLNSLVNYMKGTKRDTKLSLSALNEASNYFEAVREIYYPFESGLKTGTAEVYEHEIPGGQYSNLKAQAESLGLGDKIDQIKKNYAAANDLMGNIIKVTPSSKVIGDLALFMTSNTLTKEDILEQGENLSYPESLKSMLKGNLGQPIGGFPEALKKLVLKGEESFTSRPNEHLKPINFETSFKTFKEKFNKGLSYLDFISFLLYPKVFEDYYWRKMRFGRLSSLNSKTFFYGMAPGEEIKVQIQPGKELIIKYLFQSLPNEKGIRQVSFKLNGKTRQISVKDRQFKSEVKENVKVDLANLNEIGSPLQGRLSKIFVRKGEKVNKNKPLFVIEAMKMETTITSNKEGIVAEVLLKEGVNVEQDDLIIHLQ